MKTARCVSPLSGFGFALDIGGANVSAGQGPCQPIKEKAPQGPGPGSLDVDRCGRRTVTLSPGMTTPSEIPLFHVVGFSGHRQIIDPEGLASAIAAALDSLRQRAPGEWLGLSSVAEGGDQLFISQVRALGMSWHAI